jgi:peptidase M28-like protein
MVRSLPFVLLSLLFLTCSNESPKKEDPQGRSVRNAPVIPVFDGKKAFSYLLAQTAFGPRNAGSEAHQACLEYLRNQMAQYADTVFLQPFPMRGYNGENLHFTNIISSFHPNTSSRLLLLAHWDTRPRADQDRDPSKKESPILGANDGASGVAVLMEIARHLKMEPPQIGVDILFDDGEDYGKEGDTQNYLLGTRHFAKNLPPGIRPSFGILLDMVGDKELELQKEPYSMRYAADIVNLVWSAAKDLGVYQFTDNTQRAVLDDHLPLNEAGIRTIDLIDFNYPDASNRFWHTTEDTPDKCSPESLEAVGKVLLYVIYRQPA